MATSITNVGRVPGHHRLSVAVAVGAALLLALPAAAQSPSVPASAAPITSPLPASSPGAMPSGYTWTKLKLPKGLTDKVSGASGVDDTMTMGGSGVAADGTWVALSVTDEFLEDDSLAWHLGPTDSSIKTTKLRKSTGVFPGAVVRVGDQLMVVGSGKSWSSSDGSKWSASKKNNLKGLALHDSADNGTAAVILGNTRGKPDVIVLSTSDGKKFTRTPIEAPADTHITPGLVALSPTGAVVVTAHDNDQAQQGFEHGGYLWTSPDGVTFTQATLPFEVEAEPGDSVASVTGLAATPSGFVMSANLAGGSTAVFTSPDGQAWTQTFTAPDRRVGYSVTLGDSLLAVPASSGGGLLLIGEDALYTSPDGVTWSETLAPELAGLQGLYNAAVLPDGRIVLTLDMADDSADFGHGSAVLVGTPLP